MPERQNREASKLPAGTPPGTAPAEPTTVPPQEQAGTSGDAAVESAAPTEAQELPEIPAIGLARSSAGRYDGQYKPEFSRVHQDEDLLWVTALAVRYVLAVVGPRWSGKGLIVNYLQEKRGFAVYNLQRIVRHEAEQRGLDPGCRAVRQQLADTLRAEHSPPHTSRDEGNEIDGDGAYLARRTLRRMRDHYTQHGRQLEPPRRIVIGGLGHVDELRELARLPRFHIVRAVCSDDERRARADAQGLLARDLAGYRDHEYPGLDAVDGSDVAAAFQAVDGFDADGAVASPWAGTCAHGVGQLLQTVAERAAKQNPGPDGTEPDCGVFDVVTGADAEISAIYDRVDKIVDGLDRTYRAPAG